MGNNLRLGPGDGDYDWHIIFSSQYSLKILLSMTSGITKMIVFKDKMLSVDLCCSLVKAKSVYGSEEEFLIPMMSLYSWKERSYHLCSPEQVKELTKASCSTSDKGFVVSNDILKWAEKFDLFCSHMKTKIEEINKMEVQNG